MFLARPLSVLNLAANPHCATHRDRLGVPKHSCTQAAGGFAPNWRWSVRLVRCSTRQRACPSESWKDFRQDYPREDEQPQATSRPIATMPFAADREVFLVAKFFREMRIVETLI